MESVEKMPSATINLSTSDAISKVLEAVTAVQEVAVVMEVMVALLLSILLIESTSNKSLFKLLVVKVEHQVEGVTAAKVVNVANLIGLLNLAPENPVV